MVSKGLFKETEPKYASYDTAPSSEPGSVAHEIRRLLLLSASLCLILALVTYSPLDPSWSSWSSTGVFKNWMGRVGSILADILYQLLGLSALLLPVLPAVASFRRVGNLPQGKARWMGPALLVLSSGALLHFFIAPSWMPWKLTQPGGIIGAASSVVLSYLAGHIGSRVVAALLFIGSIVLVFRFRAVTETANFVRNDFPRLVKTAWETRTSLMGFLSAVKARLSKAGEQAKAAAEHIAETLPAILPSSAAPQDVLEGEVVLTPEEIEKEIMAANLETGGPTVDDIVEPRAKQKIPKNRVLRGKYRDWRLPGLDLLSGKAESKAKTVDKNWYIEKANLLVQKLKDFGVEGEVVHISPGPVITVYEFKPASGVKIKEIANLSDDLTLALSVLSVRIVAPIPGKPVVGIEIPSPHRETVYFKDLIQETPFYKNELRIPLALGRLASGEPVAADLASMPHLLIAGTTGTGKSVFINTLICSLLYRFSPEQMKLVLIDPKMVELSHFDGIAHLLLPVVVDSKKAVFALRWAVDEMERRYTLMHHHGVRHLDAYNEKINEKKKAGTALEADENLPYIVVVIDEYADLMAVVPKEVELCIARLAQKARASGIHLVCATQRPSTDVVTGTIKANFPSRLSFRVASSVDAKTILDRTGSERLLGHGDMLLHSAGFSTLKRMQGSYLSDSDTTRIVDFLKAQGAPEYNEDILAKYEADDEADEADPPDSEAGGDLYGQAVRVVRDKGEASISLIQRHLRIGYNRAASLMEQMEKDGIVGQAAGPAKRRSVLSP